MFKINIIASQTVSSVPRFFSVFAIVLVIEPDVYMIVVCWYCALFLGFADGEGKVWGVGSFTMMGRVMDGFCRDR